MKLMRKLVSNIVFIGMFTSLFVVNIIIYNYIIKLELINSYNNTPYNNNAITFLFDSYKDVKINLCDIELQQLLEGCVLLKNNPKKNSMYEVIYCTQDAIEMELSVITEKQWTFLSDEKIAVVGCNSSYSMGENIYSDGYTYVVSGVLKEHLSEAVNYGIFYTNCDLKNVDTQYSYVLTSRKPKDINKAYENLCSYLLRLDISIKEIDIRDAEFADIIVYNKLLNYLSVFMIVFYIIIIIFIRFVWLRIKRDEVIVLTILGYRFVKMRLYLHYMSLWGISFILSNIVFWLINKKLYCSFISTFKLSIIILLIGLLSITKMYRSRKYLL